MKRAFLILWRTGVVIAVVMFGFGRSSPCSAAADGPAMERLRAAGRNRVLGLQAMKLGDYPTATERLRRASELRPDESAIRLDLAISLFASGQYYQAAGVIKDAFRGFTREILGQARIASYFPSTQHFRSALASLERAQRSTAHDLDLDVLLSVIYLVAGQERTAQELLEMMLTLDPEQPVARFLLGRNAERKPRVAPYLLAMKANAPGAEVTDTSPRKLTRAGPAKTPPLPVQLTYPAPLSPAICFPALRERISLAGD
jgi:tetratricopeptide (TPR) repeat protein